jgi:Fur family transcriptional regulator, ferric uptake regulator
MSSVKETFRKLLKEQGYSITQARTAVFEALLDQEPLSMHDLVARTKAVDRASVYRAIDLFERLNVVQRLNTGWKYKIELTDIFTEHHHHLTCVQCNRTVAMNEQALEGFIDNLARQHGFKPTAHQIEIQGICEKCQAMQLAQVRL